MRLLMFGSFCSIICLISAGAYAQLAQQAPSATYEGQNVSAIWLIANPHRDFEPLIPLVSQKAGAPHSEKKIEESGQALENGGHFPKVDVTIVPEVTGLRVNFLLEPAYYLGIVKFPGAEKLFSYTRLSQVGNLSDEDPYDPSQVPVAEKALRDFLYRNGYFQSTVHAEPAIDDRHQLVNVIFAIHPGKQARISSVEIEGANDAENKPLQHTVRSLRARLSRALLKPGKPYTPERVKAATTLMKKTLKRQHLKRRAFVTNRSVARALLYRSRRSPVCRDAICRARIIVLWPAQSARICAKQ